MRELVLASILIIACGSLEEEPEQSASTGHSLFESAKEFAHRLPPGLLYSDADLDRDIRGIYAFGTAALDQEVLWPPESSVETFRLTVLPSFRCPYLIRLDIDNGGAQLTLKGGGRYIPSDPCENLEVGRVPDVCILGEPGPLLLDRTISLQEDKKERLGALRAAELWDEATPDPVCDAEGGMRCLDGTTFLLEIRAAGRYHYIKRNSMIRTIELLHEIAGFAPGDLDSMASERGLRCAS